MITLFLKNVSTFNEKTYYIDEETLSVVDHSCDNNEQELVKSILDSCIIDDVSSIKYIFIYDRQTEIILRNDVILYIASTSASYKDDTDDTVFCIITENRSFEIIDATLHTTDFIKLLKAQHKDEVLAYLLLTGIIK